MLRRRPADSEQALPAHLQVLAKALVGRPPVSMSTGPTTRAALAAAGKQAATVGRTIHLDHVPDGSTRSAEIVAHELVHAAAPSSVPRFFGDDHHDAEEHRAERTGRLVRALSTMVDLPGMASTPTFGDGLGRPPGGFAALGSSPAAGVAVQRVGTHGLAVTGPRAFGANVGAGGGGRDATLRRSTAGDAGHTRAGRRAGPHGGHRGPAPEPLVPERSGGRSNAAWGPLLQRFAIERAAAGDLSPAGGPVAPPGFPLTDPFGAPVTFATDTNRPGGAPSSTVDITPELVDRLVEAIEERVIEQLERRGYRHLPGVV